MPTLTVDGKQVTVPQGTRLIEACAQAGVEVPRYCYHPDLSIAGNCRMCLVEIEKMPKPQISCHLEATEGMVVHASSPAVQKLRQHILEFLLVNHPLDCPVCDQAGECLLQDYYMEHGRYESRLNENKVKKTKKAFSIGPTVMLDTERCILCSRCVRFCDEVTKTGEFGIFNRGDHAEIALYPGKELNNNYSCNVVDICPVGALLDKDFRFKCRVWYLAKKESVCTGCSRGCNMEIHYNQSGRTHVAGGDRVMRLKPRRNPEVNKSWMCDLGRYGYTSIDHNRLMEPQARSGPALAQVAWDKALDEAARLLSKDPAATWVCLSPQLTNEELYLAQKVFSAFGLKRITCLSPNPPAEGDQLLLTGDRNPNSKGAQWLGLSLDGASLADDILAGKVKGLVLFGQDLERLWGPARAQQARERLSFLIYQGCHKNPTSHAADLVLPAAVHAEKNGTFVNCEGRVQRIRKALEPVGVARPDWAILLELAKRKGQTYEVEREEHIFELLSKDVAAFKGMTYQSIGLLGQAAAAGEPVGAGR